MQAIPETTVEAVSDAERVMRDFSELLPHLLWMADAEGSVYFINQKNLNYFGVHASEILGWDWNKIIHPDDLSKVLDAWTGAIRLKTRYVVHYRLRRYDGVFRWFLCSADPQKDASGRVLRWVGNSVDIEDDKAAE